ncbi:hypothetical protein C4K02_5174 [Pseudomonas synxantha]|nr:hypothetical protein C4K02_5174 [Pseudomonas synxantha]
MQVHDGPPGKRPRRFQAVCRSELAREEPESNALIQDARYRLRSSRARSLLQKAPLD